MYAWTRHLVIHGLILRAKGDLAGARADLETAAETMSKNGLIVNAARAKVRLADLLLETGDARRAGELVSEALPAFEAEQLSTDLVAAMTVQARLTAARGDRAGALALADAAMRRAETVEDYPTRVELGILHAQLAGDATALEALRRDAAQRGFVWLARSAERASAQLE
jgi:hypothetical protein